MHTFRVMPFRLLNNTGVEGLLGAIGTIILTSVAALMNIASAGHVVVITEQSVSLMENERHMLYVILASTLGGLFGLCVFPPKLGPKYAITLFHKFAGSLLCGILFSGLTFEYFNLTPNFDRILWVSGSLGAFGVSLVTLIWPVAERVWIAWVTRKLPKIDDDPK